MRVPRRVETIGVTRGREIEAIPPARPQWRSWGGLGFGAIVAVFAFAFLRVHGLAGFSFPVPWPDESSFLWPAIAFQEHTTLFAPELNPERHVLWMPPAYAVAMGSIFKLTGFSLEWARMLSAIFLLGALAFLAGAVRRFRFPFAMLIVLCLVFLGRYFVLMGNFARMESLLVLVIAAAACELARGRTLTALALLLLGPLIHPNGAYPAAAMLLFAIGRFAREPDRQRPSALALVLLAGVAFAWIAYAVYVAGHWDAFQHDMHYQVSWKGQPGPLEAAFWSRWVSPARLVTTAILLAMYGAGAALHSPAAPLLVLAIPLHLLPIAPGDWYYEIYDGLVFAFVAIVMMDLVGRGLDRRRGDHGGAGRIAAAGCFAVAALSGAALGWIENFVGYPQSMQVAGMRIAADEKYIDAADQRAVRAFLVDEVREAERRPARAAGSPITVRFFPWADALLFHDLRSERLRFIHPTFCTADADIGITHLSRLVPNMPGFFRRERMTKRVADFPRIHVRNETEQWLYERDPAPVTHGRIPPQRTRESRPAAPRTGS